MKEMKRIISLLLCLVMLVGYLPVNARAEEAMTTEPSAVETAEETAAETTEETEPEKPGKPAKFGKHEKNDKPGKPEKEGKPEQETTPVAETTVPVTEATVPATTEATVPETTGETEPTVIAVTGITLDQTALEVGVGELPMSLTATVQPEDATDKTVTWTSSEPGVASVDENGTLTFGYMGEATITATAGEFSATCVVTVGEGEWDTYESGTVVIAASDYQLSNSGTIMTNIMNQIKEDYGTPYGVLMGGDYDAGDVKTKAQHIKNVDNTISGVFPTLSAENRIYIQGNHENYAGLKVDGANLMDTSGKNDTDHYGVYVINHDDFPWTTSTNPSPSESLVKATADALGAYLDKKVEGGYDKPIFVTSHLPLHATTRGDNRYAKLIFDELEAAGEAGLNIIFLAGHNHSGGYDQYLGNGSFYLPVGSSLTVVEGTSGKYTDSSISFTYMNYGYLGKISGSACTHQTMTVFEITDSQVTVKRYAADGVHKLKAAGVAVSGYNTDSNEIGTEGAVIELGEPEKNVEQTNNNVTVSAPGLTGLTVEKKTASYDQETYAAFASYDIVPQGYKQGKSATVTITLDAADGFDASRNVVVLDGETVLTETAIVEGKVTFTTNHFSTYSIAQRAVPADSGSGSVAIPDGGNWVTIIAPSGGTTTYTYTQATSITKNGKYVIVGNDNDVALLAEGTTMGAQNVTITGNSGSQTMTSTTELTQWTFSGTTSGTVYNGTNYLYSSGSSPYTFRIDSKTDTLYFVENGNNFTIKASDDRTGYAFYYDGSGWVTSSRSSAENVRLFQLTGSTPGDDATPGLFAKITGNLEYNVERGLTADQVLALVQAEIKGYACSSTSIPGSNAVGTEITDELEFVLDESFNGTIGGQYAVDIMYNDVVLGTATVTVPDATITGITVAPATGVVTVGASEAALVGATVTVNYADNTSAQVPVTVGMLSGNGLTTETVGTYEGLTVTYNGFTAENFTLTVREKVVNNYPSYPNEGAVKVDKKAHGVDFQKTGVAQVELTTSGVPMNQGVDVVIMLDTSSSMTRDITVGGKTVKRIDLLRPAVNELIEQLQTKRPDGSNPDIDIVIASFNGNTINTDSNYISDGSSKPQISGTGTDDCGVLTGQKTVKSGWVDIMSLSTEWGSSESNLPTGSGTNYDYGLELVYELLEQKQKDNGESTRKQFVLFMSDGAPSQYNGVWANDGVAEFAEWLLGNYDETDSSTSNDIPNTVSNTHKTFYTGYRAGKGQLHRAAEAIKGAPSDTFAYVTYDANGNGSLKTVKGLGATVYSIGLLLKDVESNYGSSSPRTAEDQQTVLNTIASSEDLAISITTVEGLGETFTRFGNDVLYAAENAVFEDQMGPNFNIQLASTTIRKVDNVAFVLDPAPTIEVREYTIWTRSELENANGTLSEENAKKVGTRKTDAEGNYIYNTLEVVRFNAEGTKAYSNKINIDNDNVVGWSTGTDGKITLDEGDNILNEGIISAKTFWYNNGTTTVKVDVDGNGTAETDLAPETFIWKVGTIKTTELALSYYVYLDESLEGDASAGSYDTNTYAILTYDNYLGNPCQKETISPQLAWLSANVSYAYYLVNKDGVPVNANGEEVTFANREIIVHPTKHEQEIKLNSLATLNNLEIASTGVLDEGNYALFDYGAKYKITVMSDSAGKWEITVGTDNETGEQLPLTTYVTNFSDSLAFTNDTYSETAEDGYDYTHTTVWFAVVWEPDALDDTVVVDYGLPVDVHVLTNDFFGDFGSLVGVAKGIVENSDNNVTTNEVPASENPVAGTFGTAQVILPETDANKNNSVIRYKLNSMEMNAPEVFTYSVDYTNTKLHTNNGFYYGTLTVIPATTIYYEDEFVGLKTYTEKFTQVAEDAEFDATETYYIQSSTSSYVKTDITEFAEGMTYYTSSYEAVTGWDTNSVKATATQDEDRPGGINFAFDTVIDANNVYGSDSAYENMSEYSMGNAAMTNVKAGKYATAEFTFYGTGFDIVSLTDNTTGVITVNVYEGDEATGNPVVSEAVDTYYGYVRQYWEETYTYTAGKWVLKSEKQVTALSGQTQLPDVPEEGKEEQTICVTRWVVSNSSDPNALYQVPVMKIGDGVMTEALPYKQYTAVITATYIPFLDHNTNTDAPGYNFYLDAIRIYNPAGTTGVNGEDTTVKDAYLADGEYMPTYFEVRDKIISASDFDALDDTAVDGIVFIDGRVEEPSIADYISYGPNNETYLASGNAVAFELAAVNKQKVQLAIKSVGGTGKVEVYGVGTDGKKIACLDETISTATDMYYDITALNGKTVVIKNGGTEDDAIISITNVKVTYTEDPVTPTDNGMMFSIRRATADAALATLTVEEDTVPETSEPVVPESSEPEATEPAEPDNSELKAAVEAAKKLKEKDYTRESYKALESARKAAEKILKDSDATQEEIDKALADLTAAVEALEAKPDNSELKAAVNAAKKLKEKDYTKESFRNVKSVLKVAEKVLKNRNATQAEIDEALAELNEAVEALEAAAPKGKPNKKKR